MKRWPGSRGYTLVEVMIFLAISSLIFVAAMVTVNGQQSRTQFAQAMRETESSIQRVINDVHTGYFPSYNNITCLAGPNITFTTAAGPSQISQGKNSQCMFLGKAIQFGPNESTFNTNREAFYVYSLAGRRFVLGSPPPGTHVTSLSQATPTAVVNTATGIDLTEKNLLGWGLQVRRVYIRGVAGSAYTSDTDVGLLGFTTSFNQFSTGSTDLVSGSQTLDIVAVPGNSVNQTPGTAQNQVRNLSSVGTSNGVVMCFFFPRTNQRASITVGIDGGAPTTRLGLDVDQIPAGCP